MYLLLLTAIIMILIAIAIIMSNNPVSDDNSSNIKIDKTIEINNNELIDSLHNSENRSISTLNDNNIITNNYANDNIATNNNIGNNSNIISSDDSHIETLQNSNVTTLNYIGTNDNNLTNNNIVTITPDGNLFSRDIKNTDISRNVCDIDKSLGLYNMSVRKLHDGYSGVIRGSTWNGCCNNNIFPSFSYVYYINLTDEGKVKNLNKIDLNYELFNNCVDPSYNIYASGIEDPRIFLFKNEEWSICNSLGLSQQQNPCVNAMCIFKISDPILSFRILTIPLNINPSQRQKNWSPFEYNGELYCEYSIDPHVILKIDIDTGLAEQKWETGSSNEIITSDTSLRGGAPPLLIYNHKILKFPEIFYLGVGHTRTRETSDYSHFFYMFESSPPFKILAKSDQFKLDGNERIQFVTGLSLYNDMIYISYGVDDCYNRISRLYLTDLVTLFKIIG